MYSFSEEFLPNLVRISISQNVYAAPGIISRAANIAGCFAEWRFLCSYEESKLPLITIVTRALTCQLGETFLAECLGYSNLEDRYIVIG